MSFISQPFESAAAPAFIWVDRPGVASIGDTGLVTDFGAPPGMSVIWDGSRWRRESFFSTPVSTPFIMPASGIVGANGALTLGTALPRSYPVAWIFLPAGAAYAGSLAGWFYVEMANTLVGTIFDDNYSTGWPLFPAVPTPIVDAGPGAYVAVVAATMGPNFVIQANMMAQQSRIRSIVWGEGNVTAGSKNVRTRFAAIDFTNLSTTGAPFRNFHEYAFRSAVDSAIDSQSSGASNTGLGAVTLSPQVVNVSVNNTLGLTLQTNLATDLVVMPYWDFEFLP